MTATTPDATSTATSDPEAALLAWTAALNAHDPDAALACFTEDAVFVNGGNGRRYTGRAIRDDFAELMTMAGDVHLEKTSLLVEGDRFADEWIMTGTHTGDVPGLPATHKPFRLTGAGVGRVRGDRLESVTVYWNLVDLLVQVGLLPPPEA